MLESRPDFVAFLKSKFPDLDVNDPEEVANAALALELILGPSR